MARNSDVNHRVANLLPRGAAAGFEVPDYAVGTGFTSEVFELSSGISFTNLLDRTVSGLSYVEAGLRAEREGFSALFINTVGDYGFNDLRAAVRVPVVGAGQTAFQLAAGLSDSFGILTVWPSTTRGMYRKLLIDYGLEARCVGIEHVAENDEVGSSAGVGELIDSMQEGGSAVLDRLENRGRVLLGDGAEVVVLGCTCMHPIAAELQKRLDCIVIDPLVAGHKFAELLVSVGLTHPAPGVGAVFGSAVPAMIDALDSDLGATECGDVCSTLSGQTK